MSRNLKNTTLAALAAAAITSTAFAGDGAEQRPEITNLIAFDMVDFVGWNNGDMDVMRHYHGSEVAVDMAGVHTDGIDPHVEMLEQILSSGTAPKIFQHSPKVAEGEWTAVVGIMTEGTMATVAKWKDGAMSEERLFMRPLTPEELSAVDLTTASLSISTPDDPLIKSAAGAEAGWTAAVGDGFVVFSRTVDGAVVEQLGFGT